MKHAAPLVLFFAGLFVLQLSCGSPSPLDPQSSEAKETAELIWLVFGLATVVFVIVGALFVYALLRASKAREASTHGGTRMIVLGGIAFPAVVLVGLMALSVNTGIKIGSPEEPDPLEIRVVGWQFWWEIHYPELGIVTANEIHVPVDRPVRIELESVDVIHSFWLPQLARKLDLIPGQTNTLWLRSESTGSFRGQCAEFCGVQHTKMAFYLVAEAQSDFDAWVNRMQSPAPPVTGPQESRGLAIFFSQNCASCHAIQGAGATGAAGPDLTHLMSRQYLAAGTLVTNRENVRSFVTNAQEIKGGSSMPSIQNLKEEELEALITYLVSLQ